MSWSKLKASVNKDKDAKRRHAEQVRLNFVRRLQTEAAIRNRLKQQKSQLVRVSSQVVRRKR